MPDFLRDYNDWWMDFWTDNPELFLVACVLAVGLVLWGRLRR